MIIFLITAVLGLVASIVIHFGLLFGILNDLPTLPMVVLNVGLVVLAGFVGVSSAMLDHRFDKEFLKEAYSAACPHWMTVATGFILLYLLVVLTYYCIAGHLVASKISFFELNMDKLLLAIITVYVGAYATAIPFYYYYDYLRKNLVRHCNNGHPVKVSDVYCDICGDELV